MIPGEAPGKGPDPRAVNVGWSQLCANGLQHVLIGGLLIDELTRHFAAVSQIRAPDLRSYIWRPGQATKIWIGNHYDIDVKTAGMRPALVVKRNSAQNTTLTIADSAGSTPEGFETFITQWVGSHTVFCWNSLGAGTELLGGEVAQDVTEFGPVIRRQFGLKAWKVIDIGPVADFEENKEGFVVPVTVGWAYEHKWMLEIESRRLKKIRIPGLME